MCKKNKHHTICTCYVARYEVYSFLDITSINLSLKSFGASHVGNRGLIVSSFAILYLYTSFLLVLFLVPRTKPSTRSS